MIWCYNAGILRSYAIFYVISISVSSPVLNISWGVLLSAQACVFDLLDGNMFDADRNVVTLKTSGAAAVVNGAYKLIVMLKLVLQCGNLV